MWLNRRKLCMLRHTNPIKTPKTSTFLRFMPVFSQIALVEPFAIAPDLAV